MRPKCAEPRYARLRVAVEEATLGPFALDEVVVGWLEENGDVYVLRGAHVEAALAAGWC